MKRKDKPITYTGPGLGIIAILAMKNAKHRPVKVEGMSLSQRVVSNSESTSTLSL